MILCGGWIVHSSHKEHSPKAVSQKKFISHVLPYQPLYLKEVVVVVMKGEMIYTINIFKLYDYLYYFWKIWEYQKRRQKLSKNEVLQLFG